MTDFPPTGPPPPPPPPTGPPPTTGPPSPADPPPAESHDRRIPTIGEWLTDTTRSLAAAFGDLFAIIVVVSLLTTAITTPLLWSGLRPLVLERDDDGLFTDVSGLTGQRAALLGVTVVVVLIAQLVMFGAATRHIDVVRTGQRPGWAASLRFGVGRAPRLVLVASQFLAIALIVNVVAVLAGSVAGGLVSGAVVLVLYVVLWVRGTLAATHGALGGEGNDLRASLRLTRGFTWALFGRMILLLTIVLGIQLMASIITSPFQGLAGATQPGTEGDVQLSEVLGSNVAAFSAGQVVSGLAGSLSVALWASANLVLYRRLGSDGG